MTPPEARREATLDRMIDDARDAPDDSEIAPANRALSVLADMARVFQSPRRQAGAGAAVERAERCDGPDVDARYRALVEQMPAVVFMAYLDEGIGEAYVSPQIEATLGYSQQEWLKDPIRWFERIHPDDKARWSVEAAEMFMSGNALRSAYRIIARDGRAIWFHCQAAMIRRDDGRPWFIQGVAIDITELKQAEQALQEERNVVATILDTVGALVAVLDPQGRIVRFNRACERASGHRVESARGRYWSEFFDAPDEASRFRRVLAQWVAGTGPADLEGVWVGESGDRRVIAWSGTVLRNAQGRVEYIIATGNEVTERKRLERAVLEVSAREQRRIGQDLHDGLGQHLTGTAFMSKVLQQRLTEQRRPEAVDAQKIVTLVNEAIEKTRELSRGLVPVVSDAAGLMGALGRFAGEVEDLFGVPCRFECDTPVLIDDVAAATHLFHIAQEAVTNAIKHGGASVLCIRLAACGVTGRLTIEDDGVGIDPARDSGAGMGLHIMRYRANMVGGSMKMTFAPDRPRGTAVECVFPLPARD